ncbi:MAG: hypothetical protein LBM77_07555, partial [Spirochaetaceae bacterium]|nr:hypothetical protein [Spirochaetaceae bacterium]
FKQIQMQPQTQLLRLKFMMLGRRPFVLFVVTIKLNDFALLIYRGHLIFPAEWGIFEGMEVVI